VRHHHPAARRQRVDVLPHHGGAVAGEVVQRADLQQGDRLGEVDQLADDGVPEHLGRAEDVGVDDATPRVAGHQRAALGDDLGVVVDVDDPGPAVGAPHDLVGVLGRGQPRSAVEVLPHPALLGEEPHDPGQEPAVGPRQVVDLGGDGADLLEHLPVDRGVVGATQRSVVDPRDARPGRRVTRRARRLRVRGGAHVHLDGVVDGPARVCSPCRDGPTDSGTQERTSSIRPRPGVWSNQANHA